MVAKVQVETTMSELSKIRWSETGRGPGTTESHNGICDEKSYS